MNSTSPRPHPTVGLRTIVGRWLWLGCIGFGGPPTHIRLLRQMCVEENNWIDPITFEDAISATNLLPGPASTQLAIFCAWTLRGAIGGIVGGICFIVPGLVLIVGLSAVFLAHHPATWILGTALGAGAAVPAIAINAAWRLAPASFNRAGANRARQVRWIVYAIAGAVAASVIGTYLVLVLVVCGVTEILIRNTSKNPGAQARSFIPFGVAHIAVAGGFGALSWVAFKVGVLSYGGGFVIIPLMQHDAVSTYHWMTGSQFLYAVALGQITPGPVVQTVAVVGYAARGVTGAMVAAVIAFAPSFAFVLGGGRHFEKLRSVTSIGSFLGGAGPAVIGAIAGSSIPLGTSFQHLWQIAVLGGVLVWLFALRKGVVSGLVGAAVVGLAIALAGVT
ncbi:MAG: chromate efflux transporter [Acidimicrobiales bacterium]